MTAAGRAGQYHAELSAPGWRTVLLAVERRTDDPVTAAQLRTLDRAPTQAAAITERGFLATLDAGSSAPVGALAELTADAGSGRRCASAASSPPACEVNKHEPQLDKRGS